MKIAVSFTKPTAMAYPVAALVRLDAEVVVLAVETSEGSPVYTINAATEHKAAIAEALATQGDPFDVPGAKLILAIRALGELYGYPDEANDALADAMARIGWRPGHEDDDYDEIRLDEEESVY